MHKLLLAAAIAALPALAPAQNVGSGTGYPTPAAPNRGSPSVPPTPTYELPPLANPLNEPGPATSGEIFVKRIEVRGVKAFKPAVIESIIKPYENRLGIRTSIPPTHCISRARGWDCSGNRFPASRPKCIGAEASRTTSTPTITRSLMRRTICRRMDTSYR
jgi:hypothetical protein